MTKADLIERLEKEGGSRELDAEIFAATSDDHATYWSLKRYQTGHEEFLRSCKRDGLVVGPTGCGTIGSVSTPNLTTSLDAATALCEKKTETREQLVAALDQGMNLWFVSGEVPQKIAKYVIIALLRALEDGK